jgi:hypothetical protein
MGDRFSFVCRLTVFETSLLTESRERRGSTGDSAFFICLHLRVVLACLQGPRVQHVDDMGICGFLLDFTFAQVLSRVCRGRQSQRGQHRDQAGRNRRCEHHSPFSSPFEALRVLWLSLSLMTLRALINFFPSLLSPSSGVVSPFKLKKVRRPHSGLLAVRKKELMVQFG